MGSTDRPGPRDLDRVGRSGGRRSVVAGVVVVALLVALAVWKPWAGAVATSPAATLPGEGAAGLIPAITERPSVPDAPAPVASLTAPTFAGLDLSVMGTIDPHDAWGVAIGYVSQAGLDAAAHARPIVTPAVNWALIDPAKPVPAPTFGHPGVTTVAIAATWPSGIRPIDIRLVRLADSVTVPLGGASLSTALGVEVPLGERLVDVVGTVTDASPPPRLGSGSFYTPDGLTSDVVAWPGLGWPASWPTHGWPDGVYAFEVDLAGQPRLRLPFVIAAGHAP